MRLLCSCVALYYLVTMRWTLLWVAPLTPTRLLRAAFFLFFALIIAVARMDWTISRDKSWEAAQTKEIFVGCMQSVAGVLSERGALMKKLDAANAELIRTRDCDTANSKRAAIERQLKASSDKVLARPPPACLDLHAAVRIGWHPLRW